jgi:tellurite resistance protein
MKNLPPIPGAFFGMVLGIGGLGAAWRVAARVWGYPAAIGDGLMLAAVIIWLAWIALYAAKWVNHRAAALTEFNDPVASFALGLLPMATLLASIGLKQVAPGVAWWLMAAGIVGGIALTAKLNGGLWQGDFKLEHMSPLTILPPVGTAYTGALAAAAFGHVEVATIMWGAGVVTWLVMDTLIIFRLLTHGLPLPLRASIGIQLAPPTVGCLAYLGFHEGAPDKAVHFLIGYGLLQLIILFRLNSWIRQQPFSPGAWAFTFGVAALAGSTLICLERQPGGALGALAWPAFVFANLFIGYIFVKTINLAVAGRLFPQAPQR